MTNIINRLDDCHNQTWDAVQDANDRAINRAMSLNEQATNELALFEVQGGILGHLEETATSGRRARRRGWRHTRSASAAAGR